MLRLELHQHTKYSPDSPIRYKDLLKAYHNRKFDVIAITDHDTIKGAAEFQRRGDFPVIIGEEITTYEKQDIIGLFLKECVPHSMSLADTIAAIKEQGGLIMAPHPFHRLGLGIGRANLEKFAAQIDIIEAYNASGEFFNRNLQAAAYAGRHYFRKAACSDAHFANEIGKAVTLLHENDIKKILTPEGLLKALQNCEYVFHSYSPLNRLPKRIYYIVKMSRHRRKYLTGRNI